MLASAGSKVTSELLFPRRSMMGFLHWRSDFFNCAGYGTLLSLSPVLRSMVNTEQATQVIMAAHEDNSTDGGCDILPPLSISGNHGPPFYRTPPRYREPTSSLLLAAIDQASLLAF